MNYVTTENHPVLKAGIKFTPIKSSSPYTHIARFVIGLHEHEVLIIDKDWLKEGFIEPCK